MSTDTQKIISSLWFDDQAEDAARFYVSVFEDGEMGEISHYTKEVSDVAGRPEGTVMTASFRIAGHDVVAINGGPLFTFTPALSLFVNCADAGEAERLFTRLAEGGSVLMPFQKYPFSEGYGWTADRYGVTWQINTGPRESKIAPSFLFVGDQCGRAEEAMQFYTSLFPDSGIESVFRYGAGDTPNAAGTVQHAIFSLANQEFRAMDSALDHAFSFNEAFSLQVLCDSQAEIDRLWNALTEGGDPAAQQCGWLKDRFGVSWQIVPKALLDMLRGGDARKTARVTTAFLHMKKFDIAALEQAYEGEPA